jgi:hypothetical protein
MVELWAGIINHWNGKLGKYFSGGAFPKERAELVRSDQIITRGGDKFSL